MPIYNPVLIAGGEAAGASLNAAEPRSGLSEAQRRGIIAMRGHGTRSTLPKDQHEGPAARDRYELLMLSTERNKGRSP